MILAAWALILAVGAAAGQTGAPPPTVAVLNAANLAQGEATWQRGDGTYLLYQLQYGDFLNPAWTVATSTDLVRWSTPQRLPLRTYVGLVQPVNPILGPSALPQQGVGIPWDAAGPFLRFSVTYLAKDEREEDALMKETVERLGKLNLRF